MTDEKIHCPVYSVFLSPRVCATRHRNANADYSQGWRPGTGDFACRDCEIGRALAAAGKHKKKEGDAMSENLHKRLECSECGALKTPAEMGIHPRSGRPWKMCPDCRKKRQAIGRKEKKAAAGQGHGPTQTPTPGGEKTYTGSAGPTMILDFTGNEKLLSALDSCANREFRDPMSQAMYIISTYLEGAHDQSV